MTCREFEQNASSLTLWELAQSQDQPNLEHARECVKCAGWLQGQRTLAAAMQTLQARTAGSAAGSHVEHALLQRFREGQAQPVRAEIEQRWTPMAVRLSRFFGVGAYVAATAAILVGLFLGVQLLEKRSANLPVQSRSGPSSVGSRPVAESKVQEPDTTAARSSVSRIRAPHHRSASRPTQTVAEPSQTIADADYVALMLCDPLSCSSEAQVVRMELPNPASAGAGGEQDAQMRIADVVVGYDGVVRAVRIVN
jgi:hypothetical protein